MPADPSIRTAVGLFFIALFSCVFFLIIGWPGVKLVVSNFATWARSVPGRIRMLRDPVYRRRVHCAARYDQRIWLLYCARGAMKQRKNGEAGHDSAAEFFASCRKEAAAYFAALTDEELDIIAEHKRAQVYAEKVPIDEIKRFLREERELIAAAPYMVQKHIEREASRFGSRAALLPSQLL